MYILFFRVFWRRYFYPYMYRTIRRGKGSFCRRVNRCGCCCLRRRKGCGCTSPSSMRRVARCVKRPCQARRRKLRRRGFRRVCTFGWCGATGGRGSGGGWGSFEVGGGVECGNSDVFGLTSSGVRSHFLYRKFRCSAPVISVGNPRQMFRRCIAPAI